MAERPDRPCDPSCNRRKVGSVLGTTVGDSAECDCSRSRGPILEIDGVHPAEYAAQWGDGSTADGCQFYNVSEQVRPGKVIANPHYTPEQWREFAQIVRRQEDAVRGNLATADDAGWTGEDADNLALLATWADARADGPQRFTYYDGESGREIVRLTEAQVFACSGSGSQDANVSATLPDVEWLADADTIRKFLKRYGAWDAAELANDEENKDRALWLACNDCAENPESYAD